MRIPFLLVLIPVVLMLTGCDAIPFKRDYKHYDGTYTGDDEKVPDFADDPYSISMVFDVPLNYQEAYRRADTYANDCRGNKKFSWYAWQVRSHLYDDDREGYVHIGPNHFGPDLERIEITALDPSTTAIKILARNSAEWDQVEMDNARKSIETGTLVCRDTRR